MTQQRSNEVDIDFLVERLSLQDFRPIRGQLYEALAELRTCRARAERAEARRRAVEMLHVWTNEDGRRFVFADDLAVALEIPGAVPAGLSLQEEQE